MRAVDLAKLVKVTRRRGAWYDGLCPHHDDRAASLSFTDGARRVVVKCRAGCSDEQVMGALGRSVRDLFFEQKGRAPDTASRLTLGAFAAAKGLPPDFLEACGVVETDRGLRIAYHQADGTLAPRQRLRWAIRAKDGSAWTPRTGPSPIPYGRDRLDAARERGELLLVEGETDALSAWLHNLPCLGIPGADMAKVLEAEDVRGIDVIYVLKEPDQGGPTFIAGIAARLAALGWRGRLYSVVLPVKDLNELHLAAGADFARQLQEAKDGATLVPSAPPEESRGASTARVAVIVRASSLEPQAVDWLWGGRLARGALSTLVGLPDQGKSLTFCDLAARISGRADAASARAAGLPGAAAAGTDLNRGG